jgi:ESCRT-II complex subunit VPS25
MMGDFEASDNGLLFFINHYIVTLLSVLKALLCYEQAHIFSRPSYFLLLQFPEFYSFPPFFTIQPVLSTREKQMGLWRELILRYHTQYRLKTLVVHDCQLWKNEDIGRELDAEGIHAVMADFIKSGHGEWEDDDQKTRVRILWRKPEQLASDIYEWAVANCNIGSVCTVYELHSGEDVHGMSFQGADEELLRRALSILEDQGKCALFKGETSSEDGIKFF